MTELSTRQALISGENAEPALVALERIPGKKGPEEMLLWVRKNADTIQVREPFRPFFWIQAESLLTGYGGPHEVEPLNGRGPLQALALFPSWKDLQKAVAWLKQKTGTNPSNPSAPFFLLNDPVQQHLMMTGRTLFKGMKFNELKRLQVDIETYSTGEFEFSNPERESDRIIAIALADQTGWTDVLSGAELDEKSLLERFTALVKEKDPDVIEGHNIFQFDLPYLITRAKRRGVKLTLGRDGREPDIKPGRFVVADRSVSYDKTEIFGRHVLDTYFLALIYDVSHRSLEGFGLKEIAVHFGVSAPDRTYLEGDEIARTFDKDPKRVMRYAADDIRETRAVSNLLSPTYFIQAQILPLAYQNLCVRGNATKIDALLLREYLRQRQAVPLPDSSRDFAGGYTDIFFTGIAKAVHHCDVRSLYPSILLKNQSRPRTDELGVFLKLLDYLRTLRLDTRQKMKASTSPEEQFHLEAMQSTFKILINSFYGYLGFSQARFSDFDLAEQVTAEGRALLRQMVDRIRQLGGQPIEIDTDGIYFIPPPFPAKSGLDDFEKSIQSSLPTGIDVEFDGFYPAMFSYKMKNYALLEENGEIIIKGAALKSRGLEPFQRQFLEEWLRLKLEGRDKEIPDLTAKYREHIEKRLWPIRMLAKTETLQDAPATYRDKVGRGGRGRNAAYELALQSGRDYRAGDQISHYVTGAKKNVAVHSSAKRVADFDPARRDENVPYYLAKLDALARKFDAMDSGQEPEHLELQFGEAADDKNQNPS